MLGVQVVSLHENTEAIQQQRECHNTPCSLVDYKNTVVTPGFLHFTVIIYR